MHPDLSFDARRVVFAFCDHTPADPNLRQFFLWEVGIDGQGLRQLTGKAADRLAGAEGRQTALIEDFDPCYLPDGGIAFVSTRTQTHIRCQYGGRYFANFLLYRADADGENIRPLSFAEAPEWEPAVLDDGRIIYSRWDYTNRHSYHFQSLWVSWPDGTATASVYGNLTRNPCNTAEPRPIPGSHKIVATAMAHHGYTAGSLVVVDPRHGLDGLPPLTRITPEIAFPETEDWPVGAYANPYPLSEDLFLAAYTPDKLAKEGQVQAENAYGIYLVDTLGGRELIYRDPAMSCVSPLPIQPRPRPPVLPSRWDAAPGEAMGSFYVRNVYQSTQPIPAGSIKSLRVVRVFPQTVETPPSRSIAVYEMPKRIVGTAPVADDGSVAFRAPAGQPLFFQLLDENGMAVMTMRALAYLQPGEQSGCIGCHESRHSAPDRLPVPCRRRRPRVAAAGGAALRRRPELRQDGAAGAGSLLHRLPWARPNGRRPRSAGHHRAGDVSSQAMAGPQQDARQPGVRCARVPRRSGQRRARATWSPISACRRTTLPTRGGWPRCCWRGTRTRTASRSSSSTARVSSGSSTGWTSTRCAMAISPGTSRNGASRRPTASGRSASTSAAASGRNWRSNPWRPW